MYFPWITVHENLTFSEENTFRETKILSVKDKRTFCKTFGETFHQWLWYYIKWLLYKLSIVMTLSQATVFFTLSLLLFIALSWCCHCHGDSWSIWCLDSLLSHCRPMVILNLRHERCPFSGLWWQRALALTCTICGLVSLLVSLEQLAFAFGAGLWRMSSRLTTPSWVRLLCIWARE
jgi:hypothetical protein